MLMLMFVKLYLFLFPTQVSKPKPKELRARVAFIMPNSAIPVRKPYIPPQVTFRDIKREYKTWSRNARDVDEIMRRIATG